MRPLHLLHSTIIRSIALLLIVLIYLPTTTVFAISNQQIQVLNEGIMDFNVDVGSSSSSCGSTVSGSDNMAKIWNWLTSKGMTAYGAAGIMGNMQVESGFNPFQIQIGAPLRTFSAMTTSSASNSGFGLVQWDGARRPAVLNTIASSDPTYKQYVADTYGLTPGDYKNAPSTVNDSFLAMELEYMYKESTPGGSRPSTWSSLLSAQSATAAANTFNEIFEGSVRSAGGPQVAPANSIYNQYKGSTAQSITQDSCSGSGNLVSGGMNLDQARAFMQKYISFAHGRSGIGLNTVSYNGQTFQLYFSGCSGGPLANCSTFSEFFVGAYTSGKQAFPAGKDMVSALLATHSGFIDGGHVPKVYAIFSRASGGGGDGHTGVVLGIDKQNNKIIIGQAGCGESLTLNNNYTVSVYDLSSWTNNTDYTYAYTDNIIKGGL